MEPTRKSAPPLEAARPPECARPVEASGFVDAVPAGSGAFENPLAELGDVQPLRGPSRVPVAPGPASRVPSVSPPSTEPLPCFVVERDDDHVRGYREDLGARALRVVESGRFFPHMSIDLHGHRVATMREELARFLREASRKGASRVLIVHGKGLHSDNGLGVLGVAVVEQLTDGPAAPLVLAFATASRRLGGTGALVVQLKK